MKFYCMEKGCTWQGIFAGTEYTHIRRELGFWGFLKHTIMGHDTYHVRDIRGLTSKAKNNV